MKSKWKNQKGSVKKQNKRRTKIQNVELNKKLSEEAKNGNECNSVCHITFMVCCLDKVWQLVGHFNLRISDIFIYSTHVCRNAAHHSQQTCQSKRRIMKLFLTSYPTYSGRYGRNCIAYVISAIAPAKLKWSCKICDGNFTQITRPCDGQC